MTRQKTINNDYERASKEKSLWDKLAGSYDNQVSVYERAYELSVEKLKNAMNSNSRVLEVACGTSITGGQCVANGPPLFPVSST